MAMPVVEVPPDVVAPVRSPVTTTVSDPPPVLLPKLTVSLAPMPVELLPPSTVEAAGPGHRGAISCCCGEGDDVSCPARVDGLGAGDRGPGRDYAEIDRVSRPIGGDRVCPIGGIDGVASAIGRDGAASRAGVELGDGIARSAGHHRQRSGAAKDRQVGLRQRRRGGAQR